MKTQILFKADIDTKGFKGKIDGLKAGIDELTIKQTKLDTSTKDGAAAFVKNDAAIKKLTRESKKYERVLTELSKGSLNSAANNKTLNSALNSEVKSVNQARASNKRLLAIRNDLNLSTKKGVEAQKKINAQVQKNNAFIKTNVSGLEKQKINIGNYGTAVGKATGALKRMVGAFAIFSLIKNSFKVVKEFEQSQANLASVLGVSTDEMKGLTEQAKELGATTTFTASQVAELALEFAKLGFSQPEIEGMTEATLALAEATGTELGTAATVVGATMRGFGLDVSETQRVTDVMAKSFSSSSLDMSKFSSAMSSVAPVAKLAGVGLEKTTALLGTLTDRGIDASSAGTGLRNMFLKSNKAGLTFDEALNKISNSTDKSKTSMELFGVKGATLGVILADTQGDVAKLTEVIQDSDGAAQDMADTQRDTLGGSIKLLQSAWEGLILKFEEGTGVFGTVKNVIKTLADNLGGVVVALGVAGGAWIAYKAVTLASSAVEGVRSTIKAVKTLGTTIKSMTIFQRLATAAQWLWNAALNANPIGLVVIAVAGLIAAGYGLLKLFGVLSSDTDYNTKANEENTIAIEASTQAIKDKISELKKLESEMDKSNKNEIDLAKAQGKSVEQIRQLERDQRKLTAARLDDTLATRRQEIAELKLSLQRMHAKDKFAESIHSSRLEYHNLTEDIINDNKRQIEADTQRVKDLQEAEEGVVKMKKESLNEQIEAENRYSVEDAAIETKANKDSLARSKNAGKEAEREAKRLAQEKIARERQTIALIKKLKEEEIIAEEELSEMIYQAGLTSQEKELTAVRDKYFSKIEEAKNYGLDATALIEEQRLAEAEINKTYSDKEALEEATRRQIKADEDAAAFLLKQDIERMNGESEHQLRREFLAEQMRIELENTELTESEKAVIRDKYNRLQGENDDILQDSKRKGAEDTGKALSSLLKTQGKENKAAAIAAATIDAALAISSILGNKTTLPEPFGSIQKAISATAAGVNAAKSIAAIQSTKAEKGISFQGTLQGPSHAQGGINLGNGIEAEGGENVYSDNGQTHIVNKKASGLINRLGVMGALSFINQREGGGVALNVPTSYASRGGLISNPSNNVEIDYAKLTEAFIQGGSQISPTVSVTDINNVGSKMVSVEDFSTI